eukprot:TRINITY_DN1118_c0_g1_i3.p1 TRINITY_DN1118_c0_g1~~TRINITY_DN1118_c0_g1_i3.p1  ORF type:complete len:119 (+),score=40.03 TRINITY_DN1118_c0_g1_i3:53-409(+)
MSTSFSHKALMEKMNSNDPDYRYMALNDLQNEFNKPGFRMEASVETKLLDKNLELLNDPAGEVKSVAVECLGVFVQHVRDASLSNIINQLTKHTETVQSTLNQQQTHIHRQPNGKESV